MSAADDARALPPGWAWATVGEVADVQLGKMLDKAKATEGVPIAYLRNINVRWGSFDLSDLNTMPFTAAEQEKFRLRAGDLLVCEGGEPGRCAVWGGGREGLYQKAIHRVRPGCALESRWLMSWMFHLAGRQELAASFTGTTIKHLPAEKLNVLRVPLPPLAEQRRIVAALDEMLGRVRAVRASLDEAPALLERARQAVLAAAFRGELTADWRAAHPAVDGVSIEEAPTSVSRTRGGKSAQRAVMGRAALCIGEPTRAAPDRWQWVRLDAIARLESGHTPSREHSEYWDGGIGWLSIPDARDHHGREIHATTQTISELGLANSSARLLPAGTVCLCRTAASIGYAVVLGREMATSQDFVDWVCSKAIAPRFLQLLFVAEGKNLRRFSMGSTHTTIYFEAAREFRVCLPPLDEQHEIVRRVEAALAKLDAVTAAVEATRTQLDAIERAVLAKAFRGELVAQDPADEPAEALLARLRAARAAGEKPAKRRGRSAG